MPEQDIPTLYEWLGGAEALQRLTTRFYEQVKRDPVVGYLEWGSRLAVINSQPGASADEHAPMPRWGWGEVKGP